MLIKKKKKTLIFQNGQAAIIFKTWKVTDKKKNPDKYMLLCCDIIIIKALANMQPGWSITSEKKNRVVELQKMRKTKLLQLLANLRLHM